MFDDPTFYGAAPALISQLFDASGSPAYVLLERASIASAILEVQYKTAWFLAHLIRKAMRSGSPAPIRGVGGNVEADDGEGSRKERSISPGCNVIPALMHPYQVWQLRQV
jgi:hypothetical protein